MSSLKSSFEVTPLPEFPSIANSVEVAAGHSSGNVRFGGNLSQPENQDQYGRAPCEFPSGEPNFTRPPGNNTGQNIVEVPKIYYKKVYKERIVEVPQVHTQVVLKEVIVPEKYDVPIVHPREVPVEQQIERNVPVPVDVVTTLKFEMRQLVPKHTVVREQVILPRYIEVPVPTHIVQVEEFEKTMVPGPPIKDYVWPHSELGNEPGEMFQSMMTQTVAFNDSSFILSRMLPVKKLLLGATRLPEFLASQESFFPSVTRYRSASFLLSSRRQQRNYSDEVHEHFQKPKNVGKFDKNDSTIGTAIVGKAACGDVIKLQVKVENDTIVDARFKTFGCGSAIASSSYVTELIKGKSCTDALYVKNTEIAEHLKLPPVKIHCSLLAEDAVRHAIKDYQQKQSELSPKET
ncbi:hypothetical protein IE077_000569 [Cardiosporidium cionae]|uniref:Iron-sulfur cluster assembly protein n=1 Tax=Cardiosporidium cionae TaxID=476202 RepID=A0ABQ7JES3_9APIC|nr:hypothetical protein IE077_000569 [Cardiosporidium cionae]|eukprot:KAF8822507.1 hypothetical protein IE077_000569 [Cardiosporidium cionae]